MKVVGITGGIGSGKTTVCKIFELLDVPIFYADEEARKLLHDKKIKNEITKIFSQKILGSTKEINRKKLADIVFENKSSLKKLNSIIHPAVRKKFENWKKKQADAKYIIEEAAILIESGANENIDFLVSVISNKQLKINRIVNRDKVRKQDVLYRMKNQMSDKERAGKSDVVIINDGEHSLIEQVLKIHHQLCL